MTVFTFIYLTHTKGRPERSLDVTTSNCHVMCSGYPVHCMEETRTFVLLRCYNELDVARKVGWERRDIHLEF
jgi:hypothetical protein